MKLEDIGENYGIKEATDRVTEVDGVKELYPHNRGRNS